jgi:hypothetical protein
MNGNSNMTDISKPVLHCAGSCKAQAEVNKHLVSLFFISVVCLTHYFSVKLGYGK